MDFLVLRSFGRFGVDLTRARFICYNSEPPHRAIDFIFGLSITITTPVYLAVLVGTILVLTSDVLLETELFEFPPNTALFYYTSYRYPHLPKDDYPHPKFSQYIKTCALFVLGMTLFLFFASGMYSEKVGYANK